MRYDGFRAILKTSLEGQLLKESFSILAVCLYASSCLLFMSPWLWGDAGECGEVQNPASGRTAERAEAGHVMPCPGHGTALSTYSYSIRPSIGRCLSISYQVTSDLRAHIGSNLNGDWRCDLG